MLLFSMDPDVCAAGEAGTCGETAAATMLRDRLNVYRRLHQPLVACSARRPMMVGHAVCAHLAFGEERGVQLGVGVAGAARLPPRPHRVSVQVARHPVPARASDRALSGHPVDRGAGLPWGRWVCSCCQHIARLSTQYLATGCYTGATMSSDMKDMGRPLPNLCKRGETLIHRLHRRARSTHRSVTLSYTIAGWPMARPGTFL